MRVSITALCQARGWPRRAVVAALTSAQPPRTMAQLKAAVVAFLATPLVPHHATDNPTFCRTRDTPADRKITTRAPMTNPDTADATWHLTGRRL